MKKYICILKKAIQNVIEIAVMEILGVSFILLCTLVCAVCIVCSMADCVIRKLEKGKCL